LPYIEERLDSPIYVALGEIHVHVSDIESPILRGAARRAVESGLFLHIHSDAATIREVFKLEPDARILWAHAGLIEAPETVSAVLDDYPNLWTDISIREYSIAPGGALAPAWRDLFMRHPDRITIGSDTWVPERWTSYENIIEFDRGWLGQLPREVAEMIAYRNAVRLFGAGPNPNLE
jgi:predicted TIM-barrel fold metal-dependent hydrolase